MLFSRQRALLIFALLLMAAVAHADPENFIVAGFTFVRPPAWKWVWDEKLAKAGLLLEIHGANTNDFAHVYFRTFNGDESTPESRIKIWRIYFKESPDQLKVRSETNHVAGFPVVYVEMEGTSTLAGPREFGLFAAIVQLKDRSFVVRMSRSRKVVKDSKVAFKAMLEQALKERVSD